MGFRFYADEQYPYPICDALRDLGHDVLTVREDGRADAGIDDPNVLSRAIQLGRAILTQDRDHFHYLDKQSLRHEGIVTNTSDSDFHAVAARIHAEVSHRTTLKGVLIKITRPSK